MDDEEDQFLHCPECLYDEPVSEMYPDSAYNGILKHVRWNHPDTDLTASVLLARITRGAERR